MKILTNKFFILGNLLLLLIAIPVTLFFVKSQQNLRSKAAPSSKLYINPTTVTTSTQCQNFTVDVMIDPGSNIVSIVDFYIKYDPTKLDITQIKESTFFPTVVRPASITAGEANMSVSVGADVTKAVQSISRVATITFVPKATGDVQIQFDSTKSRAFSLAPSDQPTENVLLSTTPGNVTIGTNTCQSPAGGTTPTVTPSTTPSISPTSNPSTTPSQAVTSVTPTPTQTAANQPPVCTDFTVSPGSTGSAPFSVLFTAKGNDPDAAGLVAKTSFNFGDGQVQNVTDGMNLKNVAVQTNHTYQNGGIYGATVTFTDDQGAVSQSCTQTITVSGNSSGSAQTTPTENPTATPTVIAAQPTVAPTGGIGQTLGIIGVVALTIIGGFILLAL